MICKSCGMQVQDNLKFCPYCGGQTDNPVPTTNQYNMNQTNMANNNIPNQINNYQNIVKDNTECGNIEYSEDYIHYECHYDLVNSDYYNDIEDENGDLLFSVIKSELENDSAVCVYK